MQLLNRWRDFWRKRRFAGELTDGARQVLRLAANGATCDGHTTFGADYVLFGMAHYSVVHPGVLRVATVVLKNLKVPLDEYAQDFQVEIPRSDIEVAQPATSFLDAAQRETLWLSNEAPYGDVVGTEHLLLAIARSQSKAAQFLKGVEVDYGKVRAATCRLLGKVE